MVLPYSCCGGGSGSSARAACRGSGSATASASRPIRTVRARMSEVRLDRDGEAVLAVDEGDAGRLRDLDGKFPGIDEKPQVTAHPDADPQRGDREIRPDGAALRRPGV